MAPGGAGPGPGSLSGQRFWELPAPTRNISPGWSATLSARAKTLVEMAEMARFYFQDPRPYEDKAAAKFLTPENVPRLQEAARRLEGLPEPLAEETLAEMFTGLAAETGRKMKDVAQPVRVALTGKTASPGLYEIISILGKKETLARIGQRHHNGPIGSKVTAILDSYQ